MVKVIETYEIGFENLKLDVNIVEEKNEFVRSYVLSTPDFGPGTKALLDNLKQSIILEIPVHSEKIIDPKFISKIREQFKEKALNVLQKNLPNMSNEKTNSLIAILLNEMLGLGQIEFLLADKDLEEIVVNASKEPVWVYHKKYSWLKTNVFISPESEIQNYSSIIARRVGKQITILNPLLDAHLVTGDRANATLFPISTKGNTITIRRFRRDPWTVTDLIRNNTVNSEIMSLIWLAMQFELNIIFSGGTASGKTTMMGICLPFIQPNHRVLTIEDTRELTLPEYLHWVPLTTREPNPEGKGEVSMLDLLVNSLRMRPDRIIVGEIRRQREAEVMFEAMHTGHSVYTSVHANTADETISRLTSPPVNIPAAMLEAVHLNVVMFRNRRIGARRILQLAEFIPERRGDGQEVVKANVLYRWKPSIDSITQHTQSIRLFDELSLHTGLTLDEMKKELKTKQAILEWLVKKDIHSIQDVGKIMAQYYMDENEVIKMVEKDLKPKKEEAKTKK